MRKWSSVFAGFRAISGNEGAVSLEVAGEREWQLVHHCCTILRPLAESPAVCAYSWVVPKQFTSIRRDKKRLMFTPLLDCMERVIRL